jgi:hypothetical protein
VPGLPRVGWMRSTLVATAPRTRDLALLRALAIVTAEEPGLEPGGLKALGNPAWLIGTLRW